MFTIWRATGVEYEYRLAWITKTAGTFQTAARFSPSCVSPTEKAPSPRNVIATRGSPRRLKASAAPTTTGHEVAEHRDEREDASRRRAEVQVAVAAERRARRLPEEVAEHVGGRRAAREVAGKLAVQRRDDVVGPEREPRACRDRLLAEAGVDRAGTRPCRYRAITRSSNSRCRRTSRKSAMRSSRPTASNPAHGSIGMCARSASVGEEIFESRDRRVD